MLPDAGDDCARLSACSSLAIPYLPDAGGDSAQPHEVARQDRRRWRHALKLLWDMRRLAPSVMGPAALATGFAPTVMGPTLASSSAARATGLAAPPATGPSALSSAVNSICKDFAWEASCPSGVTGRGKKALRKRKQRQTTTDDRRQKTTDDAVWCLGMLLLT